MEGIDLDELVDRLRSVTGHVVPARPAAVQPIVNKIDEASALIAQQALRRHPAIVWLTASRDEQDKGLLAQLRESSEADPAAAAESTIMQLLRFLNEAAQELEVERLSCVCADPTAAMGVHCERGLARLGLEELPSWGQNLESYPSPWNVFFTLQTGALLDDEVLAGTAASAAGSSITRGRVVVPNANASVTALTDLVNANVYNTEAWQRLLNAIGQFPIASVREVWLSALYTYPSSGTLAVEYLKREIDDVRQQRKLADCAEEEDAKSVLKATIRILNAFYRHLPITFNTELYHLFFRFVTERVEPDAASLDALYRTCLRRDVGNLPTSTELWTQYLEWRSRTFTDARRRREWVRRMYLRILQIPLLRLDTVKEAFEAFTAVDLKAPFAFAEKIELEKRFTRAKAEAAELDRLMNPHRVTGPGARPQPYAGYHSVQTFELYLPCPLSTFEASSDDDSVRPSRALELWSSWADLLERVERPLWEDAGAELLHYSRCRNFFLMRACMFPHQVDSWTDLTHFCLLRQPALSEGERGAAAREALAVALQFSKATRVRSTMYLFAAHVHALHLHRAGVASSLLREGLLACRGNLLRYVRGESSAVECGAVVQQLEEILTLSVNWMRLGSEGFHVSMVARFTMHNVEYLSLTMAAVKALMKSGSITEPSVALRPFNTFCCEWVMLELIRQRNASAAMSIVSLWKEHLLMMIQSSKGRGWSLASCGVDDLFLTSCDRLIKADPVTCTPTAVASMLAEIEAAAQIAEVCDLRVFTYLRKIRENAWMCTETARPRPLADSPVVGVDTRVVSGGLAPPRYDTIVYLDGVCAAAASDLVRQCAVVDEDAARVDALECAPLGAGDREDADEQTATSAAPAAAQRVIRPEEAAWPVLQSGGGGGGRHTGAPHRGQGSFGYPQHSQGPRRGGGGVGGGHSRRPWMERAPYGVRPGAGSGAVPSLLRPAGAAGSSLKRSRAHIAEARMTLLEEPLESIMTRMATERPRTEASRDGQVAGGGAGAAASAASKQSLRIPALGAVERLIRALPLISQYDPKCAGLEPISTSWLLGILAEQEAVKENAEDVTHAPEVEVQVTPEIDEESLNDEADLPEMEVEHEGISVGQSLHEAGE